MCPPCCWKTHSSRRRHWPMTRSMKRISQGSVAIHLRCGGIFSDSVIANFLLMLKNSENRLIFDELKAYKKMVPFFGLGHPVLYGLHYGSLAFHVGVKPLTLQTNAAPLCSFQRRRTFGNYCNRSIAAVGFDWQAECPACCSTKSHNSKGNIGSEDAK